ncbi:MAG: nucleotidyl transferase AbiEii/AbiGii toxin family protein [Terricaulis sp.]
MAPPSRETLQRIAGETGYQPGTLEKVLRLLDLLQEIMDDEALKDRFALKGGTALNVFHLALDRLSVDIDLNYVGALDRATMLGERPQLEEALTRILTAQGYQVRRQPDEHAGGKWIARHESSLGGQGSLEVDINFMMREPLFGAERRDSVALAERQARNVLVVDRHEIVAGKLVALLSRRAARDLFDARRIFAMPDLDWARIKAGMLAFGASGRADWRIVTVDAVGADDKELQAKLLMCLPRAYFEAHGSVAAWTQAAIAECRTTLGPLLEFTDEERAFLDGVIDRGVIDATFLNVDAGVQERIGRMPMLNWKAENVRKIVAKS